MDRIEINGVWYINESLVPPVAKFTEHKDSLEFTYFDGCVAENEKYAFEISRILKDDGTAYEGIDMEITDKKTKKKIDCWDNNTWMREVLRGDREAIELLDEVTIDNNIVMDLFKELVKKGWL